MATWRDLARDCRTAAQQAHEQGSYRAAVNRCYYAVFSEMARAASASAAGWTMPTDWEGPSHVQVYNGAIVTSSLGRWLKPAEQGRLVSLTASLYKLRRTADYAPSVEVGQRESRVAMGQMLMALRLLEEVS